MIETRTYRPDNLVSRINAMKGTVGITDFRYTYNRVKSKLVETDALRTAETQNFSYDAEQHLSGWSRGTDTQSWSLSLVGDWTSTTRAGITEARAHSPVHEITSLTRAGVTIPLTYDAKGNLTRNEDGAIYRWDVENRLASATVRDDDEGTSDTAAYAYDALGRRVQKTVWGLSTTFLHDGAQVIHEFDAQERLSATASTTDGTFDPAAVPPGGAVIAGSAALVRVNFQPANRSIPSGFVADKGRINGLRTGGFTYGWNAANSTGTARGEHPFAQFDTFTRMQPVTTASALTWTVTLANGTYPVVVVMGDCASLAQTNHVVIQGQAQSDPDPYNPAIPAGYERGDFDGYAVNAVVTNGVLTIAAGVGAIDPKLCFVEIGKVGTTVNATITTKLTQAVQAATRRTGGDVFPERSSTTRVSVYGSYVDEPLCLVTGSTRNYLHANHLYSIAAATDSTGAVVERYRYDSYGRKTVLAANGTTVLTSSAIGNQVGWTGRYHDAETGLTYFRARMYSEALGRFISREPFGKLFGWSYYGYCEEAEVGLENHTDNIAGIDYFDGMSLYQAFMGMKQYLDPSGMQQVPRPPPRPPRGGGGSGSGSGSGGFWWNGPPARSQPQSTPPASTPPPLPPRIYGPGYQPPSGLQPSPWRWGQYGRFEWDPNAPSPSSPSSSSCPARGNWVWRDYWRFDARQRKPDGGSPHSHPYDPLTGRPSEDPGRIFTPPGTGPSIPPPPAVPPGAPPPPNPPPAREPPTYGPAH